MALGVHLLNDNTFYSFIWGSDPDSTYNIFLLSEDADVSAIYFVKGYPHLNQQVEEGICQVLAYMWLEAKLESVSGSNVASTSSSASRSSTGSQYERKLGQFFKHQIESDISPVYGDGFRAGQHAVRNYGLENTLRHIRMTGNFPY